MTNANKGQKRFIYVYSRLYPSKHVFPEDNASHKKPTSTRMSIKLRGNLGWGTFMYSHTSPTPFRVSHKADSGGSQAFI